jgi:predicted TIM-barrel fold metal-dependent hydrolase
MSVTDAGPRREAHFLPEPDPRPVKNVLISVDDHVIEPPNLFDGRIPSKLRDVAPKIVEADGVQAWLLEDEMLMNIGLNAIAGRVPEEWKMEPANFQEMRPGCWQIDARISDMDLCGVYASVNFPSMLAGFAGARFSEVKNADLGLACVRAWNQWHIDEWAGPYPDRIIPLQIPWLRDADIAAAEVRKNAELGFKALSFPENPGALGFPSLFSGFWEPVLAACEETETVICVHSGSAGGLIHRDDDAPPDLGPALMGGFALISATNWLYSGAVTRFPKLKIALSEGGLGWVPMLLDRLEYVERHSGQAEDFQAWTDNNISPSEALLRNFTFCTFDDPSMIPIRHRIGIDNITVEVDYPHGDSNWPDAQEFYAGLLAGLPEDEIAKITHLNAAKLFRHPLPSDGGMGVRR